MLCRMRAIGLCSLLSHAPYTQIPHISLCCGCLSQRARNVAPLATLTALSSAACHSCLSSRIASRAPSGVHRHGPPWLPPWRCTGSSRARFALQKLRCTSTLTALFQIARASSSVHRETRACRCTGERAVASKTTMQIICVSRSHTKKNTKPTTTASCLAA